MTTRKNFAEDLAEEYDFNSKEQYFEYIVDSLINGNRSQVRELFNQMHADDKEYFLENWLKSWLIREIEFFNVKYLETYTTINALCINQIKGG